MLYNALFFQFPPMHKTVVQRAESAEDFEQQMAALYLKEMHLYIKTKRSKGSAHKLAGIFSNICQKLGRDVCIDSSYNN